MAKNSDPNDEARVRHMIHAIEEALRFVRGKTEQNLHNDRMLVLAVVKDIEILGEAASRVSDAYRERHPEVPWSVLVGIRNRLIHGYFDVDVQIIWKTVTQDLSPLKKLLDRLV